MINQYIQDQYPWCVKEVFAGKYEVSSKFYLFTSEQEIITYLNNKWNMFQANPEYSESLRYNKKELELVTVGVVDYFKYKGCPTKEVDFNIYVNV